MSNIAANSADLIADIQACANKLTPDIRRIHPEIVLCLDNFTGNLPTINERQARIKRRQDDRDRASGAEVPGPAPEPEPERMTEPEAMAQRDPELEPEQQAGAAPPVAGWDDDTQKPEAEPEPEDPETVDDGAENPYARGGRLWKPDGPAVPQVDEGDGLLGQSDSKE